MRSKGWTLIVGGFVLANLCLAGCGPKHGQPTTQPSRNPGKAPLASELLQRHNDRIGQLQTLSARGVIELRWTDDSGSHFEQGDMDLWLVLPWQIALRVHKIGEDFLWLGANEQNYWLFDLRNRDGAVLHVGSHTHGEPDASAPLKVKPLVLLDLCAMTRLEGAADGQASFDSEQGAWVATATGRGGPVRVYFDPRSNLPTRIDALDAAGQIMLSSQITAARFASVESPGIAAGSYPKIPTLINLLDPQNKDEVRIALDEESLSHRNQSTPANQRVFDLNLLIKRFQPVRTEGEAPTQAAR